MKYIKDGQISDCKVLYLDDVTIISPTEAQILDAGWQVYQPPQPSEEELAEMARQNRIAELHQLLEDSDYKAIKYAEGWITAEDYASIKTQRQEWRDEINLLESDESSN